MAVYLDEEQAGTDPHVIGFPHLLLCMGVVLQTNHHLYGFHFCAPATGTAWAFADFCARKGVNIANARRLYGCCNHAVRYGDNGQRHQAWRTEMTLIANALNYHGPASGFDTAIIDPIDGTYVEYRRGLHQTRCGIFYKRSEKMAYERDLNRGRVTATSGPVNALNPYTNTWRANFMASTGVGLAPGATTMHELNYWLRLDSFDIP